MNEVLLLIAGAIAGVVAQGSYLAIKKQISATLRSRSIARLNQHDDPVTNGRNIVRYFDTNGQVGRLYRPSCLQAGEPLPLLFDITEQFVGPLGAEDDDIVVVDDFDRRELPVDDALVQKKIARGARLWDGSSLYLKSIRKDSDRPSTLLVGVCNYFAYVTTAQQIRRESRSPSGSKNFLARYLAAFDDAVSASHPVILAASVSCVLESNGERFIALQQRSSEVVNAQGLTGVAPIFGFESNVNERGRSRYGTTTYNFVKEFSEEFYGLEHIIQAASRPRSSIDWILNLPDVARLTEEIDHGRVALYCTGAAIDISDASLTLTILAHIQSSDFTDHLQNSAIGSWESTQPADGRPIISFIPLEDVRIDQIATIDGMDPSSIMSVDLARKYFREQVDLN